MVIFYSGNIYGFFGLKILICLIKCFTAGAASEVLQRHQDTQSKINNGINQLKSYTWIQLHKNEGKSGSVQVHLCESESYTGAQQIHKHSHQNHLNELYCELFRQVSQFLYNLLQKFKSEGSDSL